MALETITFGYSSCGTRLAQSTTDGSLTLYKLSQRRPWAIDDTQHIQLAHDKPIASIHWHPALLMFACVTRDSKVYIWEVRGRTAHKFREITLDGVNKLVKYSSNGSWLAVCNTENKVTFLDVTKLYTRTVSIKLNNPIYEMDWNIKSDCLFCALENGSVQIYQVESNNDLASVQLLETLRLTNSKITSLKYSNNDKIIVVGTSDSQVLIIDAKTLCCIENFKHSFDQPIGTIDLLGELIAVTYEYTVPAEIYDTTTGKKIKTVDDCITGLLLASIKFNPIDGAFFAYNDEKGKLIFSGPKEKKIDPVERTTKSAAKINAIRGNGNTRDMRNIRDVRETRDIREMRNTRDSGDKRDKRDKRDARDIRDTRDTRERHNKDLRDNRERYNRNIKDVRDTRETIRDRELDRERENLKRIKNSSNRNIKRQRM